MSLDSKTLSQLAPEFFAGGIADAAAAEAVCGRLSTTMSDLLGIIEQETDLVRAGKLEEAGALQPEKANLVSVYMRGMTYVKDQTGTLAALAPDSVEDLKRRHAEFQPVLRINLAVLATAREVADSLMKRVARDAGAARAPSTYGPGGASPRAPTPADGIAVNRSL